MSFRQPRSKLNTKSRGKVAEPDRFVKENQKLHSEISELQSVLQLHHDLKVAEDNTVQGMLRKEIGGSRWQHGGNGKLKGYKSSNDLKDPLGLTPLSSAQRRRKPREQHTAQSQYDHSQITDVVIRPSPNFRDHQDDSSSAEELNPSKYTDKHTKRYIPSSKRPRKARTSQSVTKTKEVTVTSTGENDAVQRDLFPTDPMHIEDLKHKVLEKIGANVIKRPSRYSSKAHVRCDSDATPESHSKPEPSSFKHSTHKPKLSGKKDSYGGSNVHSELPDYKNSLHSKPFSPTKTYIVKSKNDTVQLKDCLVIENCDKLNPTCHTEEITRVQTSKEIPTSDYSSDVEACPDKSEECGCLSGASLDHNEPPHHYNNESDNTGDRNSSRISSQYVSFKSRKCLSDDVDDTPVLGIIAPLFSTSVSHLPEKNVHHYSKQDFTLQTKEILKSDHAVEVWLRNIGLRNCDKYVEIFALNEIEMNDLKYLTAEMLNKMGITAVGPVNKILMAILNLQESSQSPSSGLISEDSINTVPPVSAASTVIKHSPLLSPKVEDCIPEFTSHLQKTFENMNIKNNEVSVSELGVSDNLEKNLNQRESYIDESERRRPKSKTASTKRSSSASRAMPDDKTTNKPRMQSRSANVSTARQHDNYSGKKEGKKEKVLTSRDKSMTSRSNVPNRMLTEAVQKKAVIGISVAAHRIENRQKHDQDEQNLQLKLMRKRKQKRDELAAKHQDRKTEVKPEKETVISPTNELHIAIKTHDQMSSPELEHDPILLIPKTSQDLPADDITEVMTEERPRPSTAMPIGQRKFDVVLPTEEKSLSARERLKHVDLTLQIFKSQSNIHQKLTLDMVKELQKQLEEIEHEITHTNTEGNPESSTNVESKKPDPVKSTHTNLLKLSCERLTTSSDQTSRESQNIGDAKKADSLKEMKSSGSVMTISRSKRALLDEIRKEKDEHRKQIRHLQSELSRLQHKDPVKKSELDAKDIIFNDKDIIGEGAFSQVFRGSFQGAEVAIKRLKVPLLSQDRNYFAAEVSLLRELHHPRIVMLIGVCTSHKLPLMVLEYLSKGNLFAILHDSSREMFDHAEYYQIARDIATGMVYLHNHRPAVLHLDLKSMNVLIGIGNRAKIADFGFSKLKHDADVKAAKSNKTRQIQGSPAWMAPEMVQGGEVTAKADVYSFAIILWEMLTRQLPYENCSTFQILEKVRLGKRPTIPTDCPQELSDFIQKCWESQSTKRPNFKDVLVSLENLSFPPDWRALFQQAGVPSEALENLQSTRNIISLVTSTLESSKLSKIIDNTKLSDQLDSSSSLTEEDISSKQSDIDNADDPNSGEDSKLTVDQMSVDSLENSNTEASLTSWKVSPVELASEEGETRDFDSLSGSDESKPMKTIQTKDPIPCLLSPRMSEEKTNASTSPRKSREVWTVENIDESLNYRTENKNKAGCQDSTVYVIPAPPPLPPSLSSITRKTPFKPLNIVSVQPKLKATGHMLKEKSLGLKKPVSKTKDIKRNSTKPRQTGKTTRDGSFVLEASELQKQRTRLKSTTCPHPNQLEDLKSVSKKDLYSIAEILKDAMSERRFALGEVRTSLDTDASQSQLELSWSTQDD